MAASWTSWTRIEPYARSPELPGLRAAIHDPLWLLARQWQLGEFWGEDAGSPVHAHLEMTCTRLTRWRPGKFPAGAIAEGLPLDAAMPLEPLVEREPIRMEGHLQPRLAVESGLQFRRLLSTNRVGAHWPTLLAKFPLQAPPEDPQQPMDADTRRFLLVTAGRVLDGGLLCSIVRAVDDPAVIDRLPQQYRPRVTDGVENWKAWREKLSEPDLSYLNRAVAAWLKWYETLFSEPETAAPGDPSWNSERLEYEMLVAAPTPDGEVVLAAPEYFEGHLDWHSFDAAPGGSLQAKRSDLAPKEQEEELIIRSAIPAPVSFRGMPASRYWEFEDARVNLGALAAGPQQLARLLLIEFGLVAGDDWFVLPVVAPVGSVCRTKSLEVRDTFGERTLVSSARVVDAIPGKDDLPWDLFSLSPDRRLSGGARPVLDALFLPPALGASLHGPALEEVILLRDEMANMAWAVERIVESPLGQGLNRSEAYFRGRSRQGGAPGPRADTGASAEPLAYRLISEVPEHWVPLLPVRLSKEENAPAIGLQRRGSWQGRILDPGRDAKGDPLSAPIHEEELPREGARVIRAFQYARWKDGQTYLWVGRRKGVGRGEGSSGLQFDVLVPADRADL